MDSSTTSTPTTPNAYVASITIQQLMAPNAPRKVRPNSAPLSTSTKKSASKKLNFD